MKITTHLPHGGTAQNRPDAIVIHAMGEFIRDGEHRNHAVRFLDRYGISAHALAAPDGTVYRCREDLEQAWHARGFNRNSLGLETLVAGEHDYASFLQAINGPYVTDAQYRAILEQCIEWIEVYPIRRIVRHSDLSPGRKVDPGDGFPWRELLADLGMEG